MARNRVIYQTESLYAGPAPATGSQVATTVGANGTTGSYKIRELHRIQSCNYGYSLSRRDVNQFGELAAIDRVLLESPTVNLDFSYLNTTFYNESLLGFYINSGQGDSSAITYILDKTQDDRNYFLKTVPEGIDNIGYANTGAYVSFISVGNGFISNFQTEAAVGDFPKTTVTVEGLNVLFQTALSGSDITPFYPTGVAFLANNYSVPSGCWVANPAVNPSDGTKINNIGAVPIGRSHATPYTGAYNGMHTPIYTVSALRPGDITLNFFSAGTTTSLQEAGMTFSDAKIQSYNLSFGLTRDALQKLGSKYAFAREIRFPVNVNLSVDANIGDITTGNLVDILSNDNSYDVRISIKHPQSGNIDMMNYTLKNAKLDSQSYTSSIGPNKAVTLNFSSQIGGPLQTTKGLFFSGTMLPILAQ